MDVDRPTKVVADEVLVLDSSTFIKEVGLTKEGASALKHYLFHRGTQLVVPEVVAEECERKLATKAKGMKQNVEGNLAWLARFCGRVNGWTGPSNDDLEERAKAVANGHHLGAIVLPETDTLRARAKARNQDQRPPSHKKSGLADCRIWEQCLELLKAHDVIFVSNDADFRGHDSTDELHPHLRGEVQEVTGDRSVTFHPNIESLLSELKSEIPPIPDDKVVTFIYNTIGGVVQELESNSGCRPKAAGAVKQTRLTTDLADVIEIRLKMEDTWESADGTTTMEFQLSGSCHYHLADRQLTDLTVENVRLLTTEPDGSVRAVKGSYINVSAHIYAGGPPPVLPNRETLE